MKINFFFNPSGFEGVAIHGIGLLKAMVTGGWDVACIPDTEFQQFVPDADVEKSLKRGFGYRGPCPGIKLNLALPHRVATFHGNPRIFYTVSEVNRLPPEWVHCLNDVDEVWTASEWGRRTFNESGIKRPIRVVPEGVDPMVFKPSRNGAKISPRYRFLAVGKLEERKNYAGLFRAYCEEFAPEESVELFVHLGQAGNPLQFLFDLNLGRRHPPIRFCEPLTTRQEMCRRFLEADAFVLPTRGEGWGLPIMEAMACGLPTITTGVGPIPEYATKQNALLLDYKLVPAKDPANPFYSDLFRYGKWAEPDIDQLRHFMRWLVENPAEGRKIGQRAALEIGSKWTWAIAADKAAKALRACVGN